MVHSRWRNVNDMVCRNVWRNVRAINELHACMHRLRNYLDNYFLALLFLFSFRQRI